jgi:hypothetical protein
LKADLISKRVHAFSSAWHRYPSLYEINTLVWLSELSQRHGREITLSTVPGEEWDSIGAYGFEAVWLMGVWERSPAGIAISNQNESLLHDFRHALIDFHLEDNKGSPYCIRRYVVDSSFGGAEALAAARQELAQRGMKLVLDYVPNHVALDHPWVTEHPEYFILGDAGDLQVDPTSYVERAGTVFARGRDPFFPAWPDVLQLNAFNPGLRQATRETISSIAQQCDGIRCDMAMLLLNENFRRTWDGRAGYQPSTEYWTEIIPAIKTKYPNFLFIAESYWNQEWQLQQLGFDFCYDKTLYDRLVHNDAESTRLHLMADMSYQGKLLRFIENHDEPRAAAVFPEAKHKAVALMVATLPGLRLFHEGQFEGRTVRLPVFLGRRMEESVDHNLETFYKRLFSAVDKPVFRDGEWQLCQRTGWPDNTSYKDIVAWVWLKNDECYLIVINLSGFKAQALIQIPWKGIDGGDWRISDSISGVSYVRSGDAMRSSGLYVDLGPWGYHFFQYGRAN